MGIVAHDNGTLIELQLTEPDSNNIQVPTNFLLSDSVNFAFEFSDGSTLFGSGLFSAPNQVRYTLRGHAQIPGKTKLQLQISSASWTGSTDPPFEFDIAKKF